MDIPALGSSPHLDAVMQELEKFDMTKHALDLATYGFTVVPPEKLGTDDGFTERHNNILVTLVYHLSKFSISIRISSQMESCIKHQTARWASTFLNVSQSSLFSAQGIYTVIVRTT